MRYIFKRKFVGRIAEMISFTRITERNGYRCGYIKSMCIFLHKRRTPIRWKVLESKYGMSESQMSEIFWEMVALVCCKFEYTLQLRPSILRAHLYADSIFNQGSPLDIVVGFIGCTKISICRPGTWATSGNASFQRAVYNMYKLMPCLINQTSRRTNVRLVLTKSRK